MAFRAFAETLRTARAQPDLREVSELLAASLELLLSSPLRFARAQLPSLVEPLQRALAMGHAYPPLAAAALGMLERLQSAAPAALRPK